MVMVWCSVVSDSCDSTDCSLPMGLLCRWDFPGKDTGVGYRFLLQGIFSQPGKIKPASLEHPAVAGRLFTCSATWKAHGKDGYTRVGRYLVPLTCAPANGSKGKVYVLYILLQFEKEKAGRYSLYQSPY